MIHAWHRDLWARLVATDGRRAHAILLAGLPGQGKRVFAEAYAGHVLCSAPGADGFACGVCSGCRLRLSGNHPDLRRLIPEADQTEAVETTSSSKTKPSTQIVIDQVRQLREQLTVTGHQSGERVVIIDPPEAMNGNTANALLKLLEEPPEHTVFVLVSSAPRRLLPTIRSRCQQWDFGRPDPAAALDWLKETMGSADPQLLALTGGMPLAAAQLAGSDGAAMRQRFVDDVSRIGRKDPIMLAGDWEAWLRSKEAVAADFDLPRLADWMLRWTWDLCATMLGAQARYFPDCQSQFDRCSAGGDRAVMLDCYNAMVQIRRVIKHPLNLRLLLEDMLLRYARAVSRPGGRS